MGIHCPDLQWDESVETGAANWRVCAPCGPLGQLVPRCHAPCRRHPGQERPLPARASLQVASSRGNAPAGAKSSHTTASQRRGQPAQKASQRKGEPAQRPASPKSSQRKRQASAVASWRNGKQARPDATAAGSQDQQLPTATPVPTVCTVLVARTTSEPFLPAAYSAPARSWDGFMQRTAAMRVGSHGGAAAAATRITRRDGHESFGAPTSIPAAPPPLNAAGDGRLPTCRRVACRNAVSFCPLTKTGRGTRRAGPVPARRDASLHGQWPTSHTRCAGRLVAGTRRKGGVGGVGRRGAWGGAPAAGPRAWACRLAATPRRRPW